MKESQLERKRETDRIRAKTETGKQINKAAREKYYQSEKGKRWFQERNIFDDQKPEQEINQSRKYAADAISCCVGC